MTGALIERLIWGNAVGFLREQYLKQMLTQLREQAPALAQAVEANDIGAMQAELRRMHSAKKEAQKKELELERRLANDPFDVEAQRMLEQQIHEKNIQENMSAGMHFSFSRSRCHIYAFLLFEKERHLDVLNNVAL